MRTVLAADLGGTKTCLALVREDGSVLRREKLHAAHSIEGTASQVAAVARETGVVAAGIALPGIVEHRLGLAWAPNLWGTDWVPFQEALAARIHVPLRLTSDRTACVLGEQWLGAARGLSDVVFVTIGTGIGVGILAGGRPIEGAHGIAGAAGWMTLDRQWKAEYGRCGCWEAEAAGPATAAQAGFPTCELAVAAARAGDAHARGALRRTAAWLGAGIANLVSVLDPELVVLGGGLMEASDLLLEGLQHEFLRWAQPEAARRVRVERSTLGQDAALLGAARLALDHHKETGCPPTLITNPSVPS